MKINPFVFVLALVSACFFSITACNQPLPNPSPTPAPTPNPTPISPTELVLIESGASIATGAVLDFAVSADQRSPLANKMYSAANAIYSLSTGTLPTPAQFQAAILAFGGSQADANYASFASSLNGLYATYYAEYDTGNVSNATAILASLAAGIQDATKSYVTIATVAQTLSLKHK